MSSYVLRHGRCGAGSGHHICENTVEEKILKLQESKKGIADSIIPGQSALSIIPESQHHRYIQIVVL